MQSERYALPKRISAIGKDLHLHGERRTHRLSSAPSTLQLRWQPNERLAPLSFTLTYAGAEGTRQSTKSTILLIVKPARDED